MKKVLSVLLALVMMLSLSVVAFADDVTEVSTYAELEAAVAAGGKIKLMANIGEVSNSTSYNSIQVNKDIEVDLNGFTLYGAYISPSNLYTFVVNSGATMILDDTSASQTGQIKANYSGIETKGGTFIMNGGKIVADNEALTVAIVNFGGSVIINDGEIVAYHMGISNEAYFAETATTEINGGKITMSAESTVDEEEYGACTLIAVGGKWNEGAVEVAINDGEFDSNGKVLINVSDEGTGTAAGEVTGGDFSEEPPAELVADDADITVDGAPMGKDENGDLVEIVAPVITEQPVGGEYEVGDEVILTVGAEGIDLRYQWQGSSDGETWVDSIVKMDQLRFLLSEQDENTVHYFRCIVSNKAGSVTSNVAVITVPASEEDPVIRPNRPSYDNEDEGHLVIPESQKPAEDKDTGKANPATGSTEFVNVAIALGTVSLAAAAAVVLKK